MGRGQVLAERERRESQLVAKLSEIQPQDLSIKSLRLYIGKVLKEMIKNIAFFPTIICYLIVREQYSF